MMLYGCTHMATVGLIGLVIDETHLLTMALDQLKVIAPSRSKLESSATPVDKPTGLPGEHVLHG